MPKTFEIEGKVWKYEGPAGWYFIHVDKAVSAEIFRLTKGKKKVGFGFIPVSAALGSSEWETAIFPSKGHEYLLAIKGSIRKKEGVVLNDIIQVKLTLKETE